MLRLTNDKIYFSYYYTSWSKGPKARAELGFGILKARSWVLIRVIEQNADSYRDPNHCEYGDPKNKGSAKLEKLSEGQCNFAVQ